MALRTLVLLAALTLVSACQTQQRLGTGTGDHGLKPGDSTSGSAGIGPVTGPVDANAVDAAIDGFFACLSNNPRGRIQVTSAGTMAGQEIARCANALNNVEATLARQPGLSAEQASAITEEVRQDARDALTDAFRGY